MMSWNKNSKRASDVELWCFLCGQPVETAEQSIERQVNKMLWWSFNMDVKGQPICAHQGVNYGKLIVSILQKMMFVRTALYIQYQRDKKPLTHWARMTHICVRDLTIIGSDNGLLPRWCQAIIWTNAGILLIGSQETNFSEILIKIHTFSFKKMQLKKLSAKWRPCSQCVKWVTVDQMVGCIYATSACKKIEWRKVNHNCYGKEKKRKPQLLLCVNNSWSNSWNGFYQSKNVEYLTFMQTVLSGYRVHTVFMEPWPHMSDNRHTVKSLI